MEKNEVGFLKQLIESLDEAIGKLEKSEKDQEKEKFNRAKKTIIELQKEVDNLIGNGK